MSEKKVCVVIIVCRARTEAFIKGKDNE